ncbi:hypothetical protein [Actinacidiphila paucisporea]|uniref:Uncharacterized protein n=1 Tax=Actinacidiphila paucisporea TaxID=310782 RepID=A0A1M7P7A7_9ACTN|nr:hypothetical protein [Actinacidiphila paucisporea]SHN12586.1 hypothetical protein SAMN05216499_121109 [Actinacidiphila paucisporea]
MAAAFASAAVGLAAPVAQAATVPAQASAYYIGDDGGLWSYGHAADGTWSAAARTGPAGLAPPGAGVAAARLPDGTTNAFFVGLDGSVREACASLREPVALTAPGFAPGGAPITATMSDGRMLVTSDFPLAHFGSRYGMEIANPCSPPVSVVLVPESPKHAGGSLGSAGLADGGSGIFFVDNTGAVWARWRDRAGVPTDQQLTESGTAAPGGGVAVVSTEGAGTARGVLTLFFAGRDGRVYVAHPVEGHGLSEAPRPNLTGPANVPDGAQLSAAAGTSSVAIGYVASDGALTAVTLTTAGAWQRTTALTDAAFAAPGSSSAVSAASDGDYDFFCGNGRPGHVHGPTPGSPWTVSGPANVPAQAAFAAA